MEQPQIATTQGPRNAGEDELDAAQKLARALAEQLVHAHPPPGRGDELRLARALTLDIVDLIDEARGRRRPGDQPG
jgi:hypothetical protein